MAARSSTDNQLRIHVNSDGVVEFSVSLNDTVDPSIVATMVAAVRRGIVTPVPAPAPAPALTPAPPVPKKLPSSAATTTTATTVTTTAINTRRVYNPNSNIGPSSSSNLNSINHNHQNHNHSHNHNLNQNHGSTKRHELQSDKIRNDDKSSKLPNGHPTLSKQPAQQSRKLHHRNPCLTHMTNKAAASSAVPATSIPDNLASDRVPSPLVLHPTRSLSVRQIAAELERRPSQDSPTSPDNDDSAPQNDDPTLFDNVREFSSSPAVRLNVGTSTMDIDSSQLRAQRSGDSSMPLISREFGVSESCAEAQTSVMSPSAASNVTVTPNRQTGETPSTDHADSSGHARASARRSHKPVRMQSLPSGVCYDTVNEMCFGDDASSLTGPSDVPVNESEARQIPPTTHASPPQVPPSDLYDPGAQASHPERTTAHPGPPVPSTSMPSLGATSAQRTPTLQTSCRQLNTSSQCNEHCRNSNVGGTTNVGSVSMSHLATQMPYTTQLEDQTCDFSTLEDSLVLNRRAHNAALANDNVDTSPDQVASDVLADDGASPSASTALMLTGATVATAAGVSPGNIGTENNPEKRYGERNTSNAHDAAERFVHPPPSQDPANDAEDTWENVEYVLTDSYRQGAASGLIGDHRSLNGADIHAPIATRIARWRLLSTIGSKMGRRRGTGGTNGDGVEDIHQGTLAEGTPVYTDDKQNLGGKMGRSLIPTLFARNNVRNGALWLEFSSPLGMERMLAEVGKIARALGYQVWRRPGENKLRCIRRLTHRNEMHMVIIVGTIGLPDGPMTVVRLRRARGDRNRTESWRYAHFYRELIERLQRQGFEILGGE